jgi:hypothetical protein
VISCKTTAASRGNVRADAAACRATPILSGELAIPDVPQTGVPLQTALRILINTPLWVWPLLAYLIWQGAQALRIRTQPIWRMLIVPLVFFLMGLPRLVRRATAGWNRCWRGAWRHYLLHRSAFRAARRRKYRNGRSGLAC